MSISYEIITSRANPTVKWAASLKEKKQRECENAFLAEGIKLTVEAIRAGLEVTHVFVTESKKDRFLPLIEEAIESVNNKSCRIILANEGVIEKISTEKAPDGAISVIKYLDFFKRTDIIYKEEFLLGEDSRAIVLCSVADPSNLGSVIRSAVAFGAEHIILTGDTADIYNPKTVRSAMGSLFRIKCTRVSSFESLADYLHSKGRRLYAAELRPGAKSLSLVNLSQKDLFVIGNEGHGIPEDISRLCDGSVYIPISSKTESLNASVAAAVFMWEQSKL